MYKKIVNGARQKGITTEQAMLKSIDRVDELLCIIKESHPEEYWNFIRKTHEDLYGHHYDDEFAKYDVSQMHSTDKNGHHTEGEHWSKDEVKTVTMDKIFPPGTTDCDKYVAYNAMWHDMHKTFTDEQILDMAYNFYYADEDWGDNGKIWSYMCLRSKLAQ